MVPRRKNYNGRYNNLSVRIQKKALKRVSVVLQEKTFTARVIPSHESTLSPSHARVTSQVRVKELWISAELTLRNGRQKA